MPRRQVLVQLDDDLVEALDRLARSRGVSRSALLRSGAQAVLDAERIRTAEEVHAAAYRTQPQDPSLIEAASRLAAETAPEW